MATRGLEQGTVERRVVARARVLDVDDVGVLLETTSFLDTGRPRARLPAARPLVRVEIGTRPHAGPSRSRPTFPMTRATTVTR